MNFQTKVIILIVGLILFSIAILTIICSIYFFYTLTRKGLTKMKKKILTFKNIPSPESFKDFIDSNWYKNHNASKLHITSYDNLKLSGIFVRNTKPSKNIVILSHGYTASSSAMLCYTSYYYNKGFNILAVDNRCHGESQGKYLGMGYLDHFDILKWIDKCKELLGNDCKIILHGVSMGAATVCITAGYNPPKNVKCIISDCAYDRISDVYKQTITSSTKILATPIIKGTSLICKLMAGYYFSDAAPINFVSKTPVPILYIHGDKDTFVPSYMADNLFNATPPDKRDILLIKGAGHGEAVIKDNQTYFNKIDNFIDKIFYISQYKPKEV